MNSTVCNCKPGGGFGDPVVMYPPLPMQVHGRFKETETIKDVLKQVV